MSGWGSVQSAGQGGGGDKTKLEYCKPTPQGTTIRILDEDPVQGWFHWVQTANKGKGTTVMCIGKNCPICAAIKADKAMKVAKPRFNNMQQWSINVYNYDTKRVEVLQKGKTVFKPLGDLLADPDYGDLREYDVKIILSEDGKNCTALPKVRKPFKEQVELYDLNEILKPLTHEQIVALMNGASYAELFGDEDGVGHEPDDQADEEVDFTKKTA